MPSFNKLFNGRASTNSKTQVKTDAATATPSPHENPLVQSLPPSRCTSQIFEEEKQKNNDQLANNNHILIEDNISEKWSEHRVDFASRCTLSNKQEDKKTTYYNEIDASIFNVRAGPNYKKNKKKLPSLDSLYDIITVRTFKSKNRTKNIVDVLPLPIDDLCNDRDNAGVDIRTINSNNSVNNDNFPQVLVVHFWLPNEPPNMFSKKEDGTGTEVIFYLRPSKQFMQQIITSSSSGAISLFIKWYNTCITDNKMRSRFKCMGIVDNLKNMNSMKWLEPYNGKPTLITDSGSARKGTKDGVTYLEMSVNVHSWAFLAKKSFVSLLPRFKDMKINIGFTVEALDDEEMPECILGCVSMNYIDESMLLTIPTDLQCSA